MDSRRSSRHTFSGNFRNRQLLEREIGARLLLLLLELLDAGLQAADALKVCNVGLQQLRHGLLDGVGLREDQRTCLLRSSLVKLFKVAAGHGGGLVGTQLVHASRELRKL